MNERNIKILFADDDPDDRMLVQDALAECGFALELCLFEDGEQLLDYLYRRGKYSDAPEDKLPMLILLDINMPRKDGRETLRELKADPNLRPIPVVFLTTSQAPEDISKAYDLSVSSFIIKPSSFDVLVEIMQTLTKYWFERVQLPPSKV